MTARRVLSDKRIVAVIDNIWNCPRCYCIGAVVNQQFVSFGVDSFRKTLINKFLLEKEEILSKYLLWSAQSNVKVVLPTLLLWQYTLEKHLHPLLHFLYRCRNCRNSTDHHSSNYYHWDGSLVNVQWSYKLKNYSMSIPFKRIMLIFMTFFHNLDTNANFEWKSLSWKIYEYFLCAESLMNDNLEKGSWVCNILFSSGF